MFSGFIQSVINPFLRFENRFLFPEGAKGSPNFSALSRNICEKRQTY